MSADPLRQNRIGDTVLVDGEFSVTWDGAFFRALHRGERVQTHRVCATDDNVEEVARAWWDGPVGKARVLQRLTP